MEMKTITLSRGDLAAMSHDELTNLLLKAVKVQATAVVRDTNGNIRYDDPSKAGTYGEAFLAGDDGHG